MVLFSAAFFRIAWIFFWKIDSFFLQTKYVIYLNVFLFFFYYNWLLTWIPFIFKILNCICPSITLLNLKNALDFIFYYTFIRFLKIFYSLWTIFKALNTSENYLFSLTTLSCLKHSINYSWLFSSLLNPRVKAFTQILWFYTFSCHF